MNEELPIACSLGADDLGARLAAITEIGEQSLVGHEVDGGRRLLRFRHDDRTRGKLEAIIAAEAACCPFLDLALEDRGAELILSIAASGDGRLVADQLAAVFTAGGGPATAST
jgi:hypothetical protein